MVERETLWVCGACGRTAKSPYDFSDVSCSLNATLCYKDKIEFRGESEHIVNRVKEGGIVEPQPKFSEIEEE